MSNKYTIIEEVPAPKDAKQQNAIWVRVRCKCGKEYIEQKHYIKWGNKRVCDCEFGPSDAFLQSKRNLKHGLSKNPLWHVWLNMKNRCENEANQAYSGYGGRGIFVCAEWSNDFTLFYSWAIENGFKNGLVLDRRENDLGYSPSNCRFVTQKTNMRNTRRRLIVDYMGEKIPIGDLADKFKIKYSVLYGRIYMQGLSVSDAVKGLTTKRKKTMDINESMCGLIKEALKRDGRTQKWLFGKLREAGIKIDYYDMSRKINGYAGFKQEESDSICNILNIKYQD